MVSRHFSILSKNKVQKSVGGQVSYCMLDIGNCEKVHDKRGWSDHNTTSTTRYRENAKIQRNIHSSDNVYFEGLFARLPISRLVHWQVIFKLPLIKHREVLCPPVPVLVIRIAWWMIDSRETKAISSQMAPAPSNHQPRAPLPELLCRQMSGQSPGNPVRQFASRGPARGGRRQY